MSNVEYGKTMENFQNKIDGKHVCNEKDYLEWTLQPSYNT